MKSVYESIMTGLNEAIEDAQSEGKKLNRRTVTIIPVKEYGAEQVRNIRNSVGMSQSTFATESLYAASTNTLHNQREDVAKYHGRLSLSCRR